MQQDIHPKYFRPAVVTCACGNTFETGSTIEKISVEVCSACHPFYTGKQKMIDSARRVEKYQEREQMKTVIASSRKHLSKTAKRAARKSEKAAPTKAAKADAKAALKAAKAALSSEN